MITVSEVRYYPIKGCAGWRVDSAELTATGLLNDRLLVITTPDGMFLTQRKHPRMALIRPTIVGNQLMLAAPGMAMTTVNIARRGDAKAVTVWRDTIAAIDQGDRVAKWLSKFLQADVRLMAMDETHERKVDPNFATGAGDIVSLADGYALLAISQASLDMLNSKLAEPIGMERFRPNIVLSGTDPHAEDQWRKLRIGNIEMTGAKPCARCSVITVDQSTGIMGKEPNTTLASYRKFPRGIMFGMNLIHHNLGTISIGDEVVVSETHDPAWIAESALAQTWK